MFDHKSIETKWQKYWDTNKTFKTTMKNKKKYYALDMFPYPSGAGLHVGHPEGYTASDALARVRRMQGYDVLHPMGFDAFGLPAEQFAIKTGNHPSEFTYKNIDTFKAQLKSLGFSFDWDKQVETCDPEFFKWTQWIFTKLHEHKLAVLEDVDVNWCEELQTVLANDEIEDDGKGNKVSERGGHPVTAKKMKQWVLKITKYKDKLIKGLKDIDWPESTKTMQTNWIIDPETKELNLRDWIFSRQRYWGEPFPAKTVDGKSVMLELKDLPLSLPSLTDFKSKDGKPPLANSQEWVDNGFDLNTMPGSAGSSWYFLAYILKDENGYLDLNSAEAKKRLNYWMPVDLYIGGPEHTVGHLLYARFWNIFLSEIGILDHKEPFQKLVHQGMILGPDGLKMSKSKGNVINPDEIVEEFGADTLRLYEMFMGAIEDNKAWSTKGVAASRKWLDRFYRVYEDKMISDKDELDSEYNQLVKEVTQLYDDLKYNIIISKLMVFINDVYKKGTISKEHFQGAIQLLNPICPHITEELWSNLGNKETITYSKWPTFDQSLIKDNLIELGVQVNGKVRGTISIDLNWSKEEVLKLAEEQENVKKHLTSKPKKIIYVPGKIINYVV